MPGSEKLTHEQAAYRQFGTPSQHCARCTMWRSAAGGRDRESGRCTAVEDPIDWYGACKIFDREE